MHDRTNAVPRGTLIIIGGHEDKDGEKVILHAVAKKLSGRKKLVIATVASHEPEGYFEGYQHAFADFGVTNLCELYVENRAETLSPEKLRMIEDADGLFFSGGDQLRIISQISNTPIERRIWEIFEGGGVIAGTSAGAAVMSDIMLVRGSNAESHRIGDLHMAPGLALIRGVIIDQHFAERGRIGRLLGAVAQNPGVLGIGIDEDTAIIVDGRHFDVIGSGAVYIVDGAGVTQSNIAEASPEKALSIYDVRMHVLASGDRFDLDSRRPTEAPELEQSQALEGSTTQS